MRHIAKVKLNDNAIIAFAREITLAAINAGLISACSEGSSTANEINGFFNTLIENLTDE